MQRKACNVSSRKRLMDPLQVNVHFISIQSHIHSSRFHVGWTIEKGEAGWRLI